LAERRRVELTQRRLNARQHRITEMIQLTSDKQQPSVNTTSTAAAPHDAFTQQAKDVGLLHPSRDLQNLSMNYYHEFVHFAANVTHFIR